MDGMVKAFSALVVFPGSNRAVLVFLQAITDAADADGAFAHFLFPYALGRVLGDGPDDDAGPPFDSPRDVQDAVNELDRRGYWDIDGLPLPGRPPVRCEDTRAFAFGPGMLSALLVEAGHGPSWMMRADEGYEWGMDMDPIDIFAD